VLQAIKAIKVGKEILDPLVRLVVLKGNMDQQDFKAIKVGRV
jgi:hypothetical protein